MTERERPPLRREQLKNLARVSLPMMIREWYERDGNGAGGLLHCLLDDHNVDDESVDLDRVRVAEEGDPLAIAIVDAIGFLDEDERYAAMCPDAVPQSSKEQP